MKRRFFGLLMALWTVGLLSVSAQTSLAGRTYHHPNIMTDKDNEKDTLYVSRDGKYLKGRMDKKMSFKLTRIK